MSLQQWNIRDVAGESACDGECRGWRANGAPDGDAPDRDAWNGDAPHHARSWAEYEAKPWLLPPFDEPSAMADAILVAVLGLFALAVIVALAIGRGLHG
jgi:hypothetical protein